MSIFTALGIVLHVMISIFIRVLSLSHPMGLAAPLGVNTTLDTIPDISLETFRPYLSRPSFPFGARKQKVCDKFATESGILYMSMPSQLPAMKGCCNIFSSEPEDVSSRSQIQQIMALSLRQSPSRSEVFGPHILLPWSIAEQTKAVYTLPRTLGDQCLVVRAGSSFLNFPQATQCFSPRWSTAFHPDSRKWPRHKAWCLRH